MKKHQHRRFLITRYQLLLIFLVVAIFLAPARLSSQVPLESVENNWVGMAPMPEKRYTHASCAIDMKIYVVGGYIDGFLVGKNMIQVYDIETNSWETIDVSHQFDRGFISALSIKDKIYILGGAKGQPPIDDDNHTFFSLDVWDPETDTWQARSNFPGNNLGPTCVIGEYIYVVGGFNYVVGPVKKTYRYDIKKDKWERMADMHIARFNNGLVVNKGKIYSFGGMTKETHTSGTGDTSGEIYDPNTDTWTPGPELPIGQYHLSNSSILNINEDVYICGAARGPWANHNIDQKIYRMDGNTGRWDIFGTVPGFISFYSVTRVANKLYLIGGHGSRRNISFDISHLLSEQEESKSFPFTPEPADADQGFSLFPNPASSQTRMRFSTREHGELCLEIRNFMGQTVKQVFNASLPAGEHEVPIDLSHLDPGIYFVILHADKVSSQLLIKE